MRPATSSDAETTAIPIRYQPNRLADILRGTNVTVGSTQNNPKLLPFMEFTRRDSASDPINPWGSKVAGQNDYRHYYYAKFDTDFDNTIRRGSGGPTDINGQPTNDMPANVIVWTYNPKVSPDKPEFIIGSWVR